MKRYLVITVIELEAESAVDAFGRAQEYEACEEVRHFIQPANSVTTAAVEVAIQGAEEVTA